MNKIKNEDIMVCRNSIQKRVVLVDKQTCQKLIITDETMLNRTDRELKEYYKTFATRSVNNRM